jgi:hypothetical protein
MPGERFLLLSRRLVNGNQLIPQERLIVCTCAVRARGPSRHGEHRGGTERSQEAKKSSGSNLTVKAQIRLLFPSVPFVPVNLPCACGRSIAGGRYGPQGVSWRLVTGSMMRAMCHAQMRPQQFAQSFAGELIQAGADESTATTGVGSSHAVSGVRRARRMMAAGAVYQAIQQGKLNRS